MKQGENRFGLAKTKDGDIKVKEDSPSPSSYDIEGSFKFANEFRGRGVIDKTKRVSFCERAVKNSNSPGPSIHSFSIEKLDRISPSIHATSRKRL